MNAENSVGYGYAGVRYGARLRIKDSLYLPSYWPLSRKEQFNRLEQQVGLTPLLHFDAPNDGNIWAKVESVNPTECHYDRATLATFRLLEEAGFIIPGDIIVEGTSGSAGRSFARYAQVLGYKARILVPHEMYVKQKSRIRDIEYHGAEVIDTGEGGIRTVVRATQRQISQYRRNPDYTQRTFDMGDGQSAFLFEGNGERIVFSNHADSPITPEVFGQIGYETLQQFPNEVVPYAFVGALGNGSTIRGISEALKTRFPDVRVVGTEDFDSPTHYVRKYPKGHPLSFESVYGHEPTFKVHNTPGASVKGYIPHFLKGLDHIDEIRLVKEAEYQPIKRAYNVQFPDDKDIPHQIGNTSALNLLVARQIAAEGTNRNIVIVFYDSADKYDDWQPKSPMHDMIDAAYEQQSMEAMMQERERIRETLKVA